uniref:Uncharacterized protein n=1 Tax=Arundo donax TaxID=35708 RepID=A0A0A9A937_ARUDO
MIFMPTLLVVSPLMLSTT